MSCNYVQSLVVINLMLASEVGTTSNAVAFSPDGSDIVCSNGQRHLICKEHIPVLVICANPQKVCFLPSPCFLLLRRLLDLGILSCLIVVVFKSYEVTSIGIRQTRRCCSRRRRSHPKCHCRNDFFRPSAPKLRIVQSPRPFAKFVLGRIAATYNYQEII